jgi:hypothetical protein
VRLFSLLAVSLLSHLAGQKVSHLLLFESVAGLAPFVLHSHAHFTVVLVLGKGLVLGSLSLLLLLDNL